MRNKLFLLIPVFAFLLFFNADSSDMIYIDGAKFDMGDTFGGGDEEEKPVHSVSLDSFMMAKYETTNKEIADVFNWAKSKGYIYTDKDSIKRKGGNEELIFMVGKSDDLKCDIGYKDGIFFVKEGRDKYPVIYISWYGAVSYCNYKSEMEGKETCYNLKDWTCNIKKKGYRLPTEAEWEYAARSKGKKIKYAWGNNDPVINNKKTGNICGEEVKSKYKEWTTWKGYNDGFIYTSQVGSFIPNELGLFDMTGNVWEWCNDWYDPDFYKNTNNSSNPISNNAASRLLILRGGSWFGSPRSSRVSVRFKRYAESVSSTDGFRVVISNSK